MIRDLWTQATDSIHDIHVVNTDAVSYRSKTPDKCLKTSERENKNKYPRSCINNCRHSTLFVTSVESYLRLESETMLKRIASRLAQNWKEPYSSNCRYVKSRVVIALVKVTHSCIRKARVLA